MLDSHLNTLGHCFAASQQQETCKGESNGHPFLAGDIDDLMVYQLEHDDPMFW